MNNNAEKNSCNINHNKGQAINNDYNESDYFQENKGKELILSNVAMDNYNDPGNTGNDAENNKTAEHREEIFVSNVLRKRNKRLEKVIVLFVLISIIFLDWKFHIFHRMNFYIRVLYNDFQSKITKGNIKPDFTSDYAEKNVAPSDVIPYIDSNKFEKELQTASLEKVNKTITHLIHKRREFQDLTYNMYRSSGYADKTREEKRELLDKFNNYRKTNTIAINNRLELLSKRKSILELNSNVKNIQYYYKMTESELIKELEAYKSGNYKFYNGTKLCTDVEVLKKFVESSVFKKYSKLLGETLTTNEEENNKLGQDFIHSKFCDAIMANDNDCLEVFIAHGIDLKAIERKGSGENVLHLAVKKGNIILAKLALESGIPIDKIEDYSGETPFDLAIEKNDYEMIKLLVNQGALAGNRFEKYNKSGNVLYFSVLTNKFNIIELLAGNGIIVNEDLKQYTNNRKILRFILEKNGKNINYEDKQKDKEWEEACKFIKNDDLESLIKLEKSGKNLSEMYYDGEPGICIALKYNKWRIVEYFVNNYDCRNLIDSINGRNALHYVVMESDCSKINLSSKEQYYEQEYNMRRDSRKIIDLLIEKGFDVNAQDFDGNTALNLALGRYVSSSDLSVPIKLLEKGANPNILNLKKQNSLFFLKYTQLANLTRDLFSRKPNINQKDVDGYTPLTYSIMKCPHRHFITEVWLKNGSDVNVTNSKKQTPLHLAILIDDSYSVWRLLDHGADINKQDIDGDTPLHYVAKYAPTKRMLEEISRYKKTFDFTVKNKEGKTPLEIGEPNCFLQSKYYKDMISKGNKK